MHLEKKYNNIFKYLITILSFSISNKNILVITFNIIIYVYIRINSLCKIIFVNVR